MHMLVDRRSEAVQAGDTTGSIQELTLAAHEFCIRNNQLQHAWDWNQGQAAIFVISF
jgi:hypothetical protein